MKKVKLKLGDVLIAPIDKYDWESMHPLHGNDRVFVLQVVGIYRKSPLYAIYDGVYQVKDKIDVDEVIKRKVVAIIQGIGSMYYFTRLGNKPIPETMPYMAYSVPASDGCYISPAPSRSLMVKSKIDMKMLPRAGGSGTFPVVIRLAQLLILNYTPQDDFDEIVIEKYRVYPEAAVELFFPEAKDREWLMSEISCERTRPLIIA